MHDRSDNDKEIKPVNTSPHPEEVNSVLSNEPTTRNNDAIVLGGLLASNNDSSGVTSNTTQVRSNQTDSLGSHIAQDRESPNTTSNAEDRSHCIVSSSTSTSIISSSEDLPTESKASASGFSASTGKGVVRNLLRPTLGLDGQNDDEDEAGLEESPNKKRKLAKSASKAEKEPSPSDEDNDAPAQAAPKTKQRATLTGHIATSKVKKAKKGKKAVQSMDSIEGEDIAGLYEPQSDIIDDQDSYDVANKLTGPHVLLPVLQEAFLDDNMINLVKMKDLSVPKGLDKEDPEWSPRLDITNILQLPVQAGRSWVCRPPTNARPPVPRGQSGARIRECWIFQFDNNHATPAEGLTTYTPSANNIRPGALADVAAAQALGNLVCMYLDRWPAPIPTDEGNKNMKCRFWPWLLCKVFWDLYPTHVPQDAESRVFPFRRRPREQVAKGAQPDPTDDGDVFGSNTFGLETKFAQENASKKSDGDWVVYSRGFCFDLKGMPTETHTAGFRSFLITPSVLEIDIPAIPQWWQDLYGEEKIPDKINKDEIPMFQHARQLMQALMYQMQGTIGNKHSVGATLGERRQALMEDDTLFATKRGIWQGLRLLNPVFKIQYFDLCRGRGNKKPTWPNIRLKSTSKTVAAYIMEITNQHYLRTKRLTSAYTYGALISDLFNAKNISKHIVRGIINGCRSARHSLLEPHICQWCLNSVSCPTMIYINDGLLVYRVCENCASTGVASDDARTPQLVIRDMAYRSVREDLRRSKKTPFEISEEEFQSTVDGIVEHFTQHMAVDELEVDDDYCPGIKRSLIRDAGLSRPFQASLDSINPIAEMDGEPRLHTIGNVAITSYHTNTLKSVYPAAMLQILGDHQRLRAETVSMDDVRYKQVNIRFDHIYVIGMKLSWKVKGRMTEEVKQSMPKLKEEFYTGVSDKDFTPTKLWSAVSGAQLKKSNSDRVHAMDEYIPNVDNMLKQMAQHYKRDPVPRSKKGAPWFWIPEHMPSNWSWFDLWVVFGDRFERMDDACDYDNIHTTENTLCLVIEYGRQFLKYGGRDPWFGLQSTIFDRHPLRFALAHLRHKQLMRTGCLVPYPMDFYTDYDEALNNISFEPTIVNLAKLDHDESTYEQMLAEYSKVRVSNDIHRAPTENLPPVSQLRLLRDSDFDALDLQEDVLSEAESDNDAYEGEGFDGMTDDI